MPKIIDLSEFTRSEFKRITASFKCSDNQELEKHIKQFAFQHHQDGWFQTYLYLDNNSQYCGYISVSAATIESGSPLRSKLGVKDSMTYSLSALKITRLCVFDDFRGDGVGQALIALANIIAYDKQIKEGCVSLVVDAKKDSISFYDGLDFFDFGESDGYTQMGYGIEPIRRLDKKEQKRIYQDFIEFCTKYQLYNFKCTFEDCIQKI